MKLYLNTVSDHLWNALNKLMAEPSFDAFRLVGGTSLSLQLGHRESIDIDLFTDAAYGSLDFEMLDKVLQALFPYVEKTFKGAVGMGTSYFVGATEKNSIKLDLFYTDPFVYALLKEKGIRFSCVNEISAMKLEVVGQGGRKKDFWDLHEILESHSLESLIESYMKRYPYGHTKEEILEKLLDFSVAENDFTPNCYKNKAWELIKLDFQMLLQSKDE